MTALDSSSVMSFGKISSISLQIWSFRDVEYAIHMLSVLLLYLVNNLRHHCLEVVHFSEETLMFYPLVYLRW